MKHNVRPLKNLPSAIARRMCAVAISLIISGLRDCFASLAKTNRVFFNKGLKVFICVFLSLFYISGAAGAAESDGRFTLEESLTLALGNSLSLRIAQEGVREAEALKGEAFSGFLPKVDTSYSFTRLNAPPSFNFPGIPPLVPAREMITGTEDNYNWALEVRQTLFAGGGIRAGYEAGLLGGEMAQLGEETARLDVIRHVKTAYFGVLKAQKMVGVARQALEGLSTHRDQAEIMFKAGIIPRNDLLAAEVELANGRQYLLRAQNGLDMARSGFNVLLRREIGAPLELEDILAYRPFAATWEECLTAALTRRPEIRAAALELEQARKFVRQAESEYFPAVNFLGSYNRYGDGPDISGSAYKSRENWYVTVMANWNIWEGGRTKSRVEEASSGERRASHRSLELRDGITLELKDAYLKLREAEKQIPTAREAVAQAEENFRITRERYREQVARASDVIDAQTILTRAQGDYFNALGDYNISLAGLERAMGGGVAAAMP